MTLNDQQKKVFSFLSDGKDNVFLTGDAGTGKSFVLDKYLSCVYSNTYEPETRFPILASTGAASVLIGGRTFHSYFGIGVMKGDPGNIVNKALFNKWVQKRISLAETIFIDEISMLSGKTLAIAEEICRRVKGNKDPWGGIRIVVTGDFFQLPPISDNKREGIDWAFLSDVWCESEFKNLVLSDVIRTKDKDFTDVLNRVRYGKYDRVVYDFFVKSLISEDKLEQFKGTRIFPFRKFADMLNKSKLSSLEGDAKIYVGEYFGEEEYEDVSFKNIPVEREIPIKIDALVMLRKNDPNGMYVNGTLGIVKNMSDKSVLVKTKNGEIEVGEHIYEYLDGNGEIRGAVKILPISLAWASTIHKAQGATIDSICCDLRGVWECGQSYVAVSRTITADGFNLVGWDDNSIKSDDTVKNFYDNSLNYLDNVHLDETKKDEGDIFTDSFELNSECEDNFNCNNVEWDGVMRRISCLEYKIVSSNVIRIFGSSFTVDLVNNGEKGIIFYIFGDYDDIINDGFANTSVKDLDDILSFLENEII